MARIRINPPVAEVLPDDEQIFTAVAEPPPAMWVSVSNNGDIKSDFSLEVDAAESQVGAACGHELRSGIGAIEVTIDDQCRPTAANTFNVECFIADIAGFTYQYVVRFAASTVKVFDESTAEIHSTSHTLASGDVFRVELQAGFQLFMNGVLLHSRLGLPTTVVYPMGYTMSLFEPTATAPTRIPPPKLIGDWRLRPVVTWAPPSHGAISSIGPDVETKFFSGTVPGRYTLKVSMEASADAGGVQSATATIEIPALEILGKTEITLQPGEKRRFKTNYDRARGKLVTWSVVSGSGSFTQDEFTAASTPGETVVRATSSVNGLSADITITVPATITNANNYTAAKAGEQIDFNTNIPASIMPVLIGAGGPVSGTGAVDPGLPINLQFADLMLCFAETANEAITTPTAWSQVADSPQGTGSAGDSAATRLTVFWRRAFRGNEIVPAIADPGDHVIAQVLSFRNVYHDGNPWDVTAGDTGASSTTTLIPGDTTTGSDRLVVLASSHAVDTTVAQHSGITNADLANLTEQVDISTDANNGGGFVIATGQKAVAGAYGATTLTLANASTKGRISIALKPAVATWSASIGSIDQSGVWTAPSLAGQTAKISVTNGPLAKIIEIPVLEVFPLDDPILPVNWDRNLNASVSMSEDRKKRITRDKALPFDSYPIKFASRTLTECNAVDAFFDAHGFGTMFILDDALRGIRKVGWFDSPIRHEARDECDIDLSFQFLEARLD